MNEVLQCSAGEFRFDEEAQDKVPCGSQTDQGKQEQEMKDIQFVIDLQTKFVERSSNSIILHKSEEMVQGCLKSKGIITDCLNEETESTD